MGQGPPGLSFPVLLTHIPKPPWDQMRLGREVLRVTSRAGTGKGSSACSLIFVAVRPGSVFALNPGHDVNESPSKAFLFKAS